MQISLQCQRLGDEGRGIIVKIYTLETWADLQKSPFLVLFLKVVSRVNWSNPILSKLNIPLVNKLYINGVTMRQQNLS